MTKSKVNFSEAMKELQEINTWFQQSDIDLDEAMEKLRRGNQLIQDCRKKLIQVENEFEEIQKESGDDASSARDTVETTITIEAESDTTDDAVGSEDIPF